MKAEDLKNSILQLAMEGKLVPQDPNDEPASVLLDKIREEKEQLIKDKKIKRNNKESFIFRKNGHFYEKIGKKGEPICIDDEIPFDVPDCWEWCRFGYVVDFSLGKTPPRKEPIFWDNATIPWVAISDMVDGKIINCTQENVNNYALEKSFKGILVPKGTLLMSFKLTVGKVSILGLDAVHNEAIISIKPFIDENNCFRDYLFRVLPLISQTGDTKSAIKGKTLNSKSLNKLLIPLPPLNEQGRIVNKIEDIIPFIEEYGVDKEKLDKLNSEFPDKLKSSILQESIQGKLVSQDSNDEPASVLLERIKEEKERLIKEKKIKRNKNESFIYKKNGHYFETTKNNNKDICIDDEIPFEIPSSWEWCRLNTICTKITDGSHNPPPKKDFGIAVLSVKNINQNEIDFNSIYRFTDEEGFNKENPRTNICKGDIILGIVGSIGEVAIYKSDKKVIAQRSIAIIKTEIFNYFLTYVFESNLFKKYAKTYSKGTAQRGLYLKTLKEFLVPLPPLKEQKRIVKLLDDISHHYIN